MTDINWNEGEVRLALIVSVATLCFLMYWFVSHASAVRDGLASWRNEAYVIEYGALYRKGLGIFFLGLLPGFVAWQAFPGPLTDYGIGAADWRLSIYWILLLGGGLSVLPFFSVRREDMLAYYPEVRARNWSWGLVACNGLIWLVYLGAYEFLFRGFLLINCLELAGVWPAVAITTALSAATHMPKGPKETFGTIPFSVVLCIAVVHTGAIWAGLVVHVMLAWSNDFWALRFQPDMQIVRQIRA